MFTTKTPPALEDLDAAMRAQTEALRRMLDIQAMQGEMLARILAAVTRQPEQAENQLEAVLRDLFDLGFKHAAGLAEVVTLLKAART